MILIPDVVENASTVAGGNRTKPPNMVIPLTTSSGTYTPSPILGIAVVSRRNDFCNPSKSEGSDC